ncbi:hypothetical protein [uncultured Hymenobacter sp.]|uniref:hypothetical protein n=1 Tax=uncultured Hymenobacter sp. TaxID=170016 RepID=UPI0035CB6B56
MFWFGSTGGNNTEFFVVRIAAFLGLFCFNCYTVIALLFALISFTGVWAMYTTFLRLYPAAYKQLAVAAFFLPSVFFWGSGLMKDSLCLGALGWVFYGFYYGLILKQNVLRSFLLGGFGAYLLIMIKVYILMSFLAPASLWVFNENSQRINNALLRSLLKPFFIAVGLAVGYFGSVNLTKGDERFDVEKIGERSRITQQALFSRTKENGSAYDIGKLDGSLGSIIRVAPQAVFATLYRPFLWEARNPVMLLSAVESLCFTWFTISILFRTGLTRSLRLIAARPVLPFCLIFTLIFAVGVGVNSGNFGTLVRYKIPLMPFYLSALYILHAEATRKTQPTRARTRAAA